MRGVKFKRLFSVFLIALFLFSFAAFAADITTDSTSTTDVADSSSSDTTATTTDQTIVAESIGYSAKKSTDWLRRETESVEGLSPFQLSLVILALNNQGVNVDSDVAVLKDPANFDSETGCFPADNCKITDSSFALLALEKTSHDDFSKIEDYLLKENSLAPGLKEGEWRLQLDVAGNGTCTITYGENNKSKNFDVDDKGVIKGTSGKYYIDISKELDSSLIGTKISQPLSIDCKDLSGVASLVYYLRKGNSYFLLDSQPLSAGMANLKIVNACFRAKSGSGGCDLLSSLYGTWGLVEADVPLNEVGTLPYLESTIITSPQNDLHNAILVRILQKSGNANAYFDNLLISKQSGGSWGRGDIYTTAWALFALQKASGSYGDAVTAATSFLEKRNKDDGSWNENVQNTAMALIALYGPDLAKGYVSGSGVVNQDASNPTFDQVTEICARKMDDKYGRTGCSSLECKDSENCLCKNGRKDAGEEDVDCGGSCASCNAEELQGTGKTGEEITPGEETQPGEITPSGAGTTPKSSSSLIWIIIIIILIVAVGGLIVYLKSQGKLGSLGNIFKKKPKGPSFDEFKRQLESRPAMPGQPSRPVQQVRPMPRGLPARKPVADDELEKSLREAEKLLKGK